MMVPEDLIRILPEALVAIMACVILLVDTFLKPEQRLITYRLTQATLAGAALLTLNQSDSITAFNGHYVQDILSTVLKLSMYLTCSAVFLYSRDYLQARALFKGEYYVLALLGLLGMMVLVSAHSLLTLYLGLELLSLSLYALVAFNRDSAASTEAAMKYFVLGALASGMMLYGISMVYGATGSLDIRMINQAAAQTDLRLIMNFGLVFLVVGVGFKLGAVPFHTWVPDVYHGAATAVTLYIGSVTKLAAFALAMRILVDALGPLHADWQPLLVILVALSISVGSLVAIVQTNLKRMLAYSTIAHIGFMLLGLLAGNAAGYAAALFYILTYVLMAVGAFGMMVIISRSGFEAENIDDFRGLNERAPWLAFVMLLLMMSMAGIPLLVGFYAKLLVLEAAIKAGFLWLALFGVVFSVIGAFYYLRVVKVMYFDEPTTLDAIHLPTDTQVLMSTNGLLVVALGLYPTALMTLCVQVMS